MAISSATRRDSLVRWPRLRLKGTPAPLPLPITRRGEREPAKQPCQRLLDLAVDGDLRTLGLIRVRIHPLGRARLCARQLRDDRLEPLDATTTSRRGRRQLVVVTAADELKPALAAGPRAALILPHRPAADAARDRQATGQLHGVTISPAPAAASWQCPAAGRKVLNRCPHRQPATPSKAKAPVIIEAAEIGRAHV